MTAAIAACCTLIFSLMMPVSAPMILAFGWGLLALAPCCSLTVAVKARRHARLRA
jgi:hypothetical protein